MKVIVIGGGIGGLTTALSLLDKGIQVEVYEQAAELKEIGAGLQIGANGSRVLTRLGLGPDLERLGVAIHAIEMRDLHSDRPIHSVPADRSQATPERMTARYHGTFFQLHRPDLLGMLADAVPHGVVKLGEKAIGFVDDGQAVTVRFESGHQTRGDALIGADGIRSIVRRALQGGEHEAQFSHIAAWRALIPREKVAHLSLAQDCHVWLGPHRSAVAYWVRAGELLNFVGMVPAAETIDESWSAIGEVSAIRQSYNGVNPRLQAIIDQIDTPFLTGYYYRYPLKDWTSGRVAVLGDAAHPMHPFLAQGACQAIEDAAVLGHVLAAHGTAGVGSALAEYQQRRIARASRVQNVSRTQEPVWHMSDPRQIVQRNRALASMMEVDPNAETLYGWLYSYDVDAEAAQPLSDSVRTLKRPEAQRAWRLWDTMLQPGDLDRQHHGIRVAYDRFLLNNFAADPTVTVEQAAHGELNYLRAVATTGGTGLTVLHLHGGGYMYGSAASSIGLTSRLAAAVGGDVVVPDYRRAPEHPYPAALEDAVNCYGILLSQGVDPARLLLSGESAGGALAVALAMRLRDLDHPLPAGVVAMCPMADMAVSGHSVDVAAAADPICTRTFLTQAAANYLQGSDPRAPLASPVYGDYRGLPPLLVQVAANEALYDDATRMVDAAHRDGVQAELDTYADTVHVFQMFDFLPESTEALQRISKFATQVAQSAS